MPNTKPKTKYDHELAERSVGSVDAVARGSFGGLGGGFPLGSRTTSRFPDVRTEMDLFHQVRNIPKQQRDIVNVCMNAYEKIGILHNVIDMMSSFGCQGIDVIHPVKSREKVYKSWWNRVRGAERSERFLNGLYAAGNVVIKKTIVKLSASELRDLKRSYGSRAVASPDAEYENMDRIYRNEIPIEYTFLNPNLIETAGGDLATFVGHPTYILRIPNFIITMIRTPKSPTEQQMVADLPAYIRDAVNKGEKFVVLDAEKLAVYHYMKPDWRQWASPLTYSILPDLVLYEKMKLADMSALDGIISHIRIWLLGNLDHEIQVGPAMFEKLQNMLLNNISGGPLDLIWDAAIDLKETSTDAAKFLGAAKYEPVLKAIYAGLGIPQSLTGSDSKGAGFTNNAISLKTLIERLQYGRCLLTEFWANEFRILKEAFDDAQPPKLVFDNMSLFDEAAEKMLWFQLYDRHLVDDETIQEKFGLVPEVVSMRIKREEKQREKGKKPPKATPFHDPQTDHELTKIALQQGTLAPTETGIEKLPKKAGDKSILDFQGQQAEKDRDLQEKQADQQHELQKKQLQQGVKQGDELHNQKLQQNDEMHKQKLQHTDQEHKAMLPIKKQALRKKTQQQLQNQKKGVPGQGRPKNKKDSAPRKRKTVNPSTKGRVQAEYWGRHAQEAISNAAHAFYLKQQGKKTLRSLSTPQMSELEDIKFRVLCHIDPLTTDEVRDAQIDAALLSPLPAYEDAEEIFREMVAWSCELSGNQPSIDEQRDMRVIAYAEWCMD